jgi:hypothetical protein
MSTKNRRLTYAVVALVICLVVTIASLIAVGNLLQFQKNNDIYNTHYEGLHTGEEPFQLVDSSLSKYINLTSSIIEGAGNHPKVGQGYDWAAGFAKLTWIGSAKDSVRSIQNIHLVVYSRIDQNNTFGSSQWLNIGLHAVVNQTEPTIPNDAIGYEEITVPILGIDNSTYSYFYNCSTNFFK